MKDIVSSLKKSSKYFDKIDNRISLYHVYRHIKTFSQN